MNAQGHLDRANEIQASVEFLMTDPQWERHLATIVEDCYGAAQHLISYALEMRYGVHPDTHRGMARQLREHGHGQVADWFGRLEQLRMGRWYGGRQNGRVIRQCRRLLGQIRQWAL